MRVRTLDAAGDMAFGSNAANFLVDSPAAVGQAIMVRFGLWQGEWFLDTTIGMPWNTQVLGKNTQPLYDAAIIQRILDAPGVAGIADYQSSLDTAKRILTASATVTTQFGANVSVTIPIIGTRSI